MNRWAPAASVIALCLGLVLIAGISPARPATVLTPAVAAVTTTPVPVGTASPTATPTPPIPDGYRIKIPRLAIDLPIVEGDVERDAVRQETPDNFALHLPGRAAPGDRGNVYIHAHARRGMFLTLSGARVGDEGLGRHARCASFATSSVKCTREWTRPTGRGPSDRITAQREKTRPSQRALVAHGVSQT